MASFEITWSMFGTATIDAPNEAEAAKLASSDLMNWGGFGVDLEDVQVDGADIEVDG